MMTDRYANNISHLKLKDIKYAKDKPFNLFVRIYLARLGGNYMKIIYIGLPLKKGNGTITFYIPLQTLKGLLWFFNGKKKKPNIHVRCQSQSSVCQYINKYPTGTSASPSYEQGIYTRNSQVYRL